MRPENISYDLELGGEEQLERYFSCCLTMRRPVFILRRNILRPGVTLSVSHRKYNSINYNFGRNILTKSPISFHFQFNFSRVSRGRRRPRQNASDDLLYLDPCFCLMCPICSQVSTGLFNLGKLRF